MDDILHAKLEHQLAPPQFMKNAVMTKQANERWYTFPEDANKQMFSPIS